MRSVGVVRLLSVMTAMSAGLAIVGCGGSGEDVQSSAAGPGTGDGGADADAGKADAKDGAADTVVDRTGDARAGADATGVDASVDVVLDGVVDATDGAAPDGDSSAEAKVDAGGPDSDAAVDCGPIGPADDTCAEATNLGALSEGATGTWNGSIQSASDVDTFTITLRESSHACPPDTSSPFFVGNISVTSNSPAEVDIVSDDAYACSDSAPAASTSAAPAALLLWSGKCDTAEDRVVFFHIVSSSTTSCVPYSLTVTMCPANTSC